MDNMDFSGASDITQLITEEKKVDEPQMMEFSSSVSDLVPPSQDVYTNPANQRVSGLSLPNDPIPQQKGSKNPFNLTDDQFNAAIAGIIAVIVFSTAFQTKLAGIACISSVQITTQQHFIECLIALIKDGMIKSEV
jgi:hypothetical protein